MTNLKITQRSLLTKDWPLSLSRSAERVQVITPSAEGGTLVEQFDEHLRPVARRNLRCHTLDVATNDMGEHWLLTQEGACLLAPDLTLSAPLRERDDQGLELRAITLVDDDLLLIRQHGERSPQAPARLTRISTSGEERWSIPLSPADLVHTGVVEMRVTDDWTPRVMKAWKPQTWLLQDASIPISGDRALLTFSEMPRSGIGYGYVVSLDDGEILHTTERGPISKTAAYTRGRFLVGYQGYGDFKTQLYGRDGRVEDEWPSHGFYIVGDDGVRVVEMENRLPSKMRLASLSEGGSVRHGSRLEGYYTSPPLHRDDGSVLFVRNGSIFLCQGLDVSETLRIVGMSERASGTASVAIGGAMFVAVQGDAMWELLRVEVS